MASEHVVNADKNKGNNSLFSIFNRLIKSKHKNGKTCAALFDYLIANEENVGSVSAVDYSAKRLVRGLAAGEKEKQNVFYSALCTGLSKNILTANLVLQSLNNIIENIGSSKAEQSSKQITAVLAYGAVLSSVNASELKQDDLKNALAKLISTVNLKSHLKVAAALFLSEFILNGNKVTIKNNFLPVLSPKLKGDGDKIENELFAVCALSYLKFPKVMQKVVEKHFGGRNKLFEDICDRSFLLPLQFQEQLLTLLCQEFTATLSTGAALIKLWKKFLDKEKDQKTTFKRSAYILLFFKIIMDSVPYTELICQSLQPIALDVLLKSHQVHDKKAKSDICYIRAKQIVEKLIARITDKSNESNFASQTIKIIFNHPGGFQFDKKTRSNAIQSMIMSLDTTEVVHLADGFVLSVTESIQNNIDQSKTPKDIESMLVMLAKLVANPSIKKDNKLLSKYITFYFDIAFKKSLNVNSDLRTKAAELFFKCLELNHVKIDDAAGILNDIVSYAGRNIDKLIIELKEPERKQWDNMLAANAKLGSKSSDKKYVAVRLLLLHMGLLMFRDQTLASSTIEELLQCYERIKEKKRKKTVIATDEEEPHWVEVTIDLLLAMLSRENKLLRHVVSSVFPGIVPHLTATVIQQIIDALDPGSRNDVLKHIDSDDSEAEEEYKEESDEEVEDEESEGSDVDAEEETVNDKLRMAVRNALGYSAALTDDESVDMDEMNEDEEKRLNESLASAFQLFRSGKKKKQTKDDEAHMHFRIRVLDLVEIIISTNPAFSCCLELLNPLFTLLENSIKDGHQKPLQNRLEAVLKKLGGVKKFADESDVLFSDVVTALTGLFERDTSGLIYVEMAPAITECCGMLIRGSQLSTRTAGDLSLEDVLSTLLTRHFKGNDRKVPYSVFQICLRMLWEGNWTLSKNIMTMLLDTDLKLFKKFKLIELLEIFYKNDRLQSSATDDCKKAVCIFENKFVKKFTKSLVDYETKKSTNLLPTFYGRLISFVQLVMQVNARLLEKGSKTSPWVSVVSHLLSNIQHLPQQKARNKLIHLAQQSGLPLPDKPLLKVKHQKRVTAEGGEEDANNENQKRKKSTELSQGNAEKGKRPKHSAEVKKLKQETRDLREAAFSQGLVPVNFSNINVETLGQIQPELKNSKRSAENSTESPVSTKKSRKSEVTQPKKKKQKLV